MNIPIRTKDKILNKFPGIFKTGHIIHIERMLAIVHTDRGEFCGVDIDWIEPDKAPKPKELPNCQHDEFVRIMELLCCATENILDRIQDDHYECAEEDALYAIEEAKSMCRHYRGVYE